MRLCDSDGQETENPAHTLEKRIQSIREERLSVVLFGFANGVRRALEKYLREWFLCDILGSVDDAEPDLVLVEEDNDRITREVERTAKYYGRRGVLLSIAMVADALANPMRPVAGYVKWERIQRPIGPSNL